MLRPDRTSVMIMPNLPSWRRSDRDFSLVPHHQEGAPAANRERRSPRHFTIRRCLGFRHRIIALLRSRAYRREIEVRQIRVGRSGASASQNIRNWHPCTDRAKRGVRKQWLLSGSTQIGPCGES